MKSNLNLKSYFLFISELSAPRRFVPQTSINPRPRRLLNVGKSSLKALGTRNIRYLHNWEDLRQHILERSRSSPDVTGPGNSTTVGCDVAPTGAKFLLLVARFDVRRLRRQNVGKTTVLSFEELYYILCFLRTYTERLKKIFQLIWGFLTLILLKLGSEILSSWVIETIYIYCLCVYLCETITRS